MADMVVTRNGQITITKEIRERLGIREGDSITMNLLGNAILISKKNPDAWDKLESFLPSNFEQILASIRKQSNSRIKKLFAK